jgi:serine/threonine protein kinase
VFDDILSFHNYVNAKGYVAVDFYDGSIMYDFTQKKTMICDIDFYVKMPHINNMGRMWGSARFMSPEEFKLGAEIDAITNVYLMGATAFALLSDYKRTFDKWPLSEDLWTSILFLSLLRRPPF